ncbi:hypothetical protein BDD12DRAFT_781369 [Trichophaea hybrida]|nr:hypothetical protein BDD12DRAFT_781369 [Trichophaea hybrida]
MDVGEAAQLFSQRCPQYKSAQDAEAVSKLLESLDYLPLAVVGATSFMIEMNTSPSEYLELLNSTQQTRQELLLTQFNDVHREVLETSGSDMTESVLSTYYITFKQIEKQLPLAADFLRLIAFLDRQGIQEELLAASKLDDVDNKVLFRKAIGKLVDFSLVTRAEGGTMLALHRLVHLSIETYLSPQETKEWRTKALDLVSGVFPQRVQHENRHTCATYLPHALVVTHNSDSPVTSSLLYRMAASVLADKGKYEQAEQMNRRALEGREKVLGPDHPDTMTSVNNLAQVLQSQGKCEQAEQMNRRVLEGREKVLEPDHPDTLTSVNNLALVLQSQGKYEQAEQINRRALEGREKVLGPDHPDTLTSVNNLALVLQSQGKYEQAELMNRRALEGYEKVLGPDHPDTLTSVSNLALVLQSQGKYEEAEQMNRRALEGREKALGPDHAESLLTVWCMADLYKRQRRFTEAMDAYERASIGFVKALGNEHPDTVMCLKQFQEMMDKFGTSEDAARDPEEPQETTEDIEH